MTSINLGNQCFKTCSWIPLTIVKFLLSNSALLETRIQAQPLTVLLQVQYWTKMGIRLQFAESTYIRGFRLHFTESTYKCGIQNNQLYLLVAEFATKQICRQNLLHSYMYAESTEMLFVESTYMLEHIFKTCLSDPRTNRHNTVLLSIKNLIVIQTKRNAKLSTQQCFFNFSVTLFFFQRIVFTKKTMRATIEIITT